MRHTSALLFRFVFALLIFAELIQNTWATNYVAIDLHPSYLVSSYALGVTGTQQVGSGVDSSNIDGRAILWNNSAESVVDLTPIGFTTSEAVDTDGAHQVGYANNHAMLWNGSAESYVDLNPNGCEGSHAYGIGGSQQVGFGSFSSGMHAVLWNGSAQSFVDLNPAGFNYTAAFATDGLRQVGASDWFSGGGHAFLWSGTADSAIDLNPPNFDRCFAMDIRGLQQVGWGEGSATNNKQHALMWTGSAESVVDLNPDAFSYSAVFGTNGTNQVGYGSGALTGNEQHAILWSNSAENFIDLHQFLSSGFVSSEARSIDALGNIVGEAYDSTGNYHAILWQVVPEPTTLIMLATGVLAMLFVYRRNRPEK
jgi:hypothetical protein